MNPITETKALAALCERLSSEDFVTVDTEFLRDKTYWPKLCLVQLAGDDEAQAVDPLAKGIDLAPLYELLADKKVLKVFHAARQDVEIFYHQAGKIPAPIFDTQVAAMVCGFGDSVGYETLVNKIARASIDKSSRFTDWARRPLTDKQLKYALSDVTHLRKIYRSLRDQLEKNDRLSWLDSEMDILTDPATYDLHPEEAWRRLKVRTRKPRFLAVLREIAAWREEEAQSRDLPRNRIIRDEGLLEIASHQPQTPEALERTRGLANGFSRSRAGEALLAAVKRGAAVPEDQAPTLEERPELPRGAGPTIELLKVLLKMKCEEHNVAQKLVASTADLEQIVLDDAADVPALKGWRREVFGEAALDLKHGRLGLAVAKKGGALTAIELG